MNQNEIKIYGATWCPDCRRAKKFLSDQRIAFEWHDLEVDPEAQAVVQARNDGNNIIPTVIFPDDSFLAEPTNEELAEKLGIQRTAEMHAYDLIIVGGGPAGLTTAIYAARENLATLIIDSKGLGGQAGVTEKFDNYPGFPEGVKGPELMDLFRKQAEKFAVSPVECVTGTHAVDRHGGETIQDSVHHVNQPHREEQGDLRPWKKFHAVAMRQGRLPEHGHDRRVQAENIEPEPPLDVSAGRGGDGLIGHRRRF